MLARAKWVSTPLELAQPLPHTHVMNQPKALCLIGLLWTHCTAPPVPSPHGDLIPIVPGLGLQALRVGWETPATGYCRARVVLEAALPDPDQVSDRRGEWVRLRNLDPEPVDLTHFHLTDGRRRRFLDGIGLSGGAALKIGTSRGIHLRPIRLRNGQGAVSLVDPCGLTISCLAWDRTAGGVPVLAPRLKRVQPPRRGTFGHDGGPGGCGQT